MRTRFINKMTSYEVEDYLKRNDIIFIPMGVIENHGSFPMDVELITPTAFARIMAEEVDGLILGDLPYLYCGANCISRGTVKMSVEEGYRYLKEICYSLMTQGFRRQILLSFHGPAFLTGAAVATDFFHETKCPIAYIDGLDLLKEAGRQGYRFPDNGINKLFYGSYQILNLKEELVIDPDAEPLQSGLGDAPGIDFFSYVRKLCHQSVGFYFSKPEDHGGRFGACHSIEERDQLCLQGEKIIRELLEKIDMPRFVRELKELDQWTNTYIRDTYGDHIPLNKFSAWDKAVIKD